MIELGREWAARKGTVRTHKSLEGLSYKGKLRNGVWVAAREVFLDRDSVARMQAHSQQRRHEHRSKTPWGRGRNL